ncbi:hypothetical protein PFLUV_G00149740 [Perca fluviatilis]|uniref:Uncharacterized protein n=1 Tax=Perca fluviatilis TaxID=8168 RepID=A0A6A5EXK6_PERFL|nr:hypothetical protein PFLUV_G00149740 [Perca fluviatilis]
MWSGPVIFQAAKRKPTSTAMYHTLGIDLPSAGRNGMARLASPVLGPPSTHPILDPPSSSCRLLHPPLKLIVESQIFHPPSQCADSALITPENTTEQPRVPKATSRRDGLRNSCTEVRSLYSPGVTEAPLWPLSVAQ